MAVGGGGGYSPYSQQLVGLCVGMPGNTLFIFKKK